MFATCSSDGCIFVWESQYPVKMKYQYNMESFKWESALFSQFNSSDTLLLVSGGLIGSRYNLSGEIAIFSLTSDLDLQCRVEHCPCDMLSTWYSEHYFLHANLFGVSFYESNIILWLNEAYQELSCENIPSVTQLFRFPNSENIGGNKIMLANCLTSEEQEDQASSSDCARCTVRQKEVEDKEVSLHASSGLHITPDGCFQYINRLQYNQEYNSENRESLHIESSQQYKENIQSTDIEESNVAEVANCCEKYLIFIAGLEMMNMPHVVAFKRIKNVQFPTSIYPGRSYTLKEWERELETEFMEQNYNPALGMDVIFANYQKLRKVDSKIDLQGRIVGMGLSPDHRYLYVNIKPWPQNVSDFMDDDHPLPPVGRVIDIRVIDLVTLKEVGHMSTAHTAYVEDNIDCNNIFPDVCDEYVASGIGDKHGYLWDRYYGVSLAKFHHSDTVNSVAFNPRDPEMLVTTSDDHTIKIWRSRSKVHELGLNEDSYPRSSEIRNRSKYRKSSNPDLPNQ